jgi:hypothetical protein
LSARNILFEILQNDQVPNQLIKAVHNIYKNNLIPLKVGIEYTEWKSTNLGVHQGCSLLPLLFIEVKLSLCLN